MEAVKAIEVWLASWWAYFDFCLEADISAIICKPFWTGVMVTLYGTGGLVVIWLATRFISFRLKMAAALKAEAARTRIADEDTMKQHTWDGDKAFQTHERSEDKEQRI